MEAELQADYANQLQLSWCRENALIYACFFAFLCLLVCSVTVCLHVCSVTCWGLISPNCHLECNFGIAFRIPSLRT